MINVNCLNNIASVGLDLFSSDYNANAAFEEADAAGFVNGIVLPVDGGYSAYSGV